MSRNLCSGCLMSADEGRPTIRPIMGSARLMCSLRSSSTEPVSMSRRHRCSRTRGCSFSSKGSVIMTAVLGAVCCAAWRPCSTEASVLSWLVACALARMTGGGLTDTRQEQPGSSCSRSMSDSMSSRMSLLPTRSAHSSNTFTTSAMCRPDSSDAGQPYTVEVGGVTCRMWPWMSVVTCTQRHSSKSWGPTLATRTTCFMPSRSSRLLMVSLTGHCTLVELWRNTTVPLRQLVLGICAGWSLIHLECMRL
mmetsp:Transcript_33993/g.86023  ORF Transcript_33993/g.86023 Transcript_33993/m.86023 type:complete len:250 (-) Transcript_33993:399-1148(-)